MTSGKTISENIKKIRANLGLTQDDLAKKADVKYTTLTKVESGVVNKPSVQTMAKLPKHWVFQLKICYNYLVSTYTSYGANIVID